MKKYTKKIGSNKVSYYIQGKHPGLLVLSGIHGDEFEVVDLVKKELKARASSLPDFCYLPIVSPTAVALRTRHNKEGVDLNRHFLPGTQITEARLVMSILKPLSVRLVLSFHEDVHEDRFYLYDSGRLAKKDLAKLRHCLKEQKIGLLNGCDDPHDECLGFEFTDGYISHVPTCDHRPTGSLESYLIRAKIAQRVFGIEVPGRLSLAKKRRVVAAVFDCLISCFFG